MKTRSSVVASGLNHLIFLKDGCLYSYGNSNYGQLGLGYENVARSRNEPIPEEFLIRKGIKKTTVCATVCESGKNEVSAPASIDFYQIPPKKFDYEKIENLYCTQGNTTFLTTSSGRLFAWGENLEGQLAMGHKSHSIWYPVEIDFFRRQRLRIKNIFCYYAVFAQLENGNIYCWGFNKYGQCGIGSRTNIHRPVKFSLPENEICLKVACGDCHTTFLSRAGNVFYAGTSVANKGTSKKVTKLNDGIFQGKKFIEIANGGYWGVFVTSDHEVFTGKDEIREIIPLRDKKIYRVETGKDVAVFMSLSGEIYLDDNARGLFKKYLREISPKNAEDDSIYRRGAVYKLVVQQKFVDFYAGEYFSVFVDHHGDPYFTGKLGQWRVKELVKLENMKLMDFWSKRAKIFRKKMAENKKYLDVKVVCRLEQTL